MDPEDVASNEATETQARAIATKVQESLDKRLDTVDASFATIGNRLDEQSEQLASHAELLKHLEDEGVRHSAEERDDYPGCGKNTPEDPERQFSLFRAMRGFADNWRGWNDKEHPEREAVHAAYDFYRKRDLTDTVDSEGGFLVPPVFMEQELIPLLRASSITIGLGATVMDDLVGSPVEIPRITSGATGYWVNPGTAITESQPAFGDINLTPHGAAALTPISNRLLRQSSGAAERVVREDLMRVVGLQMDLGVLKGTAADGQPTGITNWAGIGSEDWDTWTTGGASQDTFAHLNDQIGNLEDGNVPADGSWGWALHPKLKRKFQGIIDADGRQLLMQHSSPQAPFGPADRLWGYPFATTTQLTQSTTSDLIFARWRDVIIAQWGAMAIDSSGLAKDGFETRRTYVRAVVDMDVGLRHAASVSIANNLDIDET